MIETLPDAQRGTSARTAPAARRRPFESDGDRGPSGSSSFAVVSKMLRRPERARSRRSPASRSLGMPAKFLTIVGPERLRENQSACDRLCDAERQSSIPGARLAQQRSAVTSLAYIQRLRRGQPRLFFATKALDVELIDYRGGGPGRPARSGAGRKRRSTMARRLPPGPRSRASAWSALLSALLDGSIVNRDNVGRHPPARTRPVGTDSPFAGTSFAALEGLKSRP